MIFLEWMVALPESVSDYYDEQMETLQEETTMTYISSFERKAMEKGVAQGSLSILLKLLNHRFGELDQAALEKLHDASPEQLERWAENILDAQTLEEVLTLH
ncbi:DUF4351 domain-containing protein [Halopseudomonas xiamenensis]|uniref:DUF4351 domain-containing protein n=1 Tax=Halopseudomonas xiamenensis TaxID=157792 RepID=UPI001626A26E|nr:DUF4351 domain-containing protein [Halopseudomonas xiamenensis]